MKRVSEDIEANEIQAILVKNRYTGEIAHSEIFHSGRMSPSRLANLVSGKINSLERKYSHTDFDLIDEIFGSIDSFYSAYPELSHIKPS